VKTDRNIEVRNFRIHGAKVGIYFGIEILDFGFFYFFECAYINSKSKLNKSEIPYPKSEIINSTFVLSF
jgi:hypothetical protein